MRKKTNQPRYGPSGALLLGVAGALAAAQPALAQHGHLNAGAVGQNQGDRLKFANGDAFAASSGYVKELSLATSGTYAGFYQGGITLTALPATPANGGPVPDASAPGSFLMVGVVSVDGPLGGSFGIWEEGATSPTLSYSVGYDAVVPTGLLALSDAENGAGAAGADPFGHLHGRRFTATEPGEYSVDFKLFDVSANGTGGGPIHTPSEVLTVKFSAIPEPGTVALLGLGATALGLALRRRGTKS